MQAESFGQIPKRLSETKPRLRRQTLRPYHGNMGKVLSLGSSGPRFDPESLHTLSEGQKAGTKGRGSERGGRGSLRVKGRS